MYLNKAFHFGILMLMALSIFVISCKKDKIDDHTTEVNQPTPTTQGNLTDKAFNSDPNAFIDTPPIGIQEVRNIIDAKGIIRKVIKESLTQLFLNRHFNPYMPPIVTRVDCVGCAGDDCGCPYQIDVEEDETDPLNTAHELTLKYKDVNTCGNCTLSSTSGLEVFGDLIIDFSADFNADHTITIKPQDNFVVDGFDIDGGEIVINYIGESSTDITEYQIFNIANVSVTNTTTTPNVTTEAKQISPKSRLYINDVGDIHGATSPGFGLLDDIFELYIDDLVLICNAGSDEETAVFANTVDTDNLIYDMECDMIQDGSIQLNRAEVKHPSPFITTYHIKDALHIYDYGAPASGNDPGVCDDEVAILPIPSED